MRIYQDCKKLKLSREIIFLRTNHTNWLLLSQNYHSQLKNNHAKPKKFNFVVSRRQISFSDRHIGPTESEKAEMLEFLGHKDIDTFTDSIINPSIRSREITLPQPLSETECLEELKRISQKNKLYRSYIGNGYYNTITPPAIIRNILENPGWYTPYTPYQPEISQGRLEMLLIFQTLVSSLTGLEVSNCSLLDEASACAEAVSMALRLTRRNKIVVATNYSEHSKKDYPQLFDHSLGALQTRADSLLCQMIYLNVENMNRYDFSDVACVVFQYPCSHGTINISPDLLNRIKLHGGLCIAATDPMSLVLIKSPGELGFDISFGSMQRFGVPLGYGGPHAGFFSARDDEKIKREVPGRIVGVTKDADGNKCYRLARQTREQHIKREKATSNICTAQALLANVSAAYALYHGESGLKEIGGRIHSYAVELNKVLSQKGYDTNRELNFFDTVMVNLNPSKMKAIKEKADNMKINFRYSKHNHIFISLDETTTDKDFNDILEIFECQENSCNPSSPEVIINSPVTVGEFSRKSPLFLNSIFNSIHSETQLMRFLKNLENKDVSLCNSMIPLGSCTMKLNAAASMRAFMWSNFADIHPYVPRNQARGYEELINSLSRYLTEITGMDGSSFQSNSGSAGEYNGLLTVRRYLDSINQGHRNICLIPVSAHGTNPSSAALAGFIVKPIKTSENGVFDLNDLKSSVEMYKDNLAAIMLTFPSTYGLFEPTIIEICELVHNNGGQVYLDGANMNAQVGLCKPGELGADLCHLNLHKTFSIPHGGGGPGMGPIMVKKHLIPHLCGHPSEEIQHPGSISSAPFGSPSILTISLAYIRMMGGDGLTKASKTTILNSNYAAKILSDHYNVLFFKKGSAIAHEFIIDLGSIFKNTAIDSIDIAKRLIDYGFNPPTISFPLSHSLMVEPTESESKLEIDQFCQAMISIRKEIAEIENGNSTRENNLIKNAPHTISVLINSEWNFPYSREQAAYPLEWVKGRKIWPYCRRANDSYGDRNLVCLCN